MRTQLSIITVLLTLGGTAAADDPPAPAAELDALAPLRGTWSCKGHAPEGPFGPERDYASTIKIEPVLGGYFWASSYDQKKSKANPAPASARGYLSFDGKALAFDVFVAGGAKAHESVTFDGTTLLGTGTIEVGGQSMGWRETMKVAGKKLTWTGELQVGKDWLQVGEDRCTRRKK